MGETRSEETPLDVLNRLDGKAPLSSSDAGLYTAEEPRDALVAAPERFDMEDVAMAFADAASRGIQDPVFQLGEFDGVSALDARQVAEALGAGTGDEPSPDGEPASFDAAWTRTCLEVADALEQGTEPTGPRGRAIQLLAADYLNEYAYDEDILDEFDSQLGGSTELLADVLRAAAIDHVQADLDLAADDFKNRATCDLDVVVGEVKDWLTPEGVCNPRDLYKWFKDADEALTSKATGMPACFGPNYRVGPGRYVSGRTWEAVLPTQADRALYLILANEGTDEDIFVNTFDNMGSADWLVFESELALKANPEVFFVAIDRDDFTQEELGELASERPELFTAEELKDLSEAGVRGANEPLERQASAVRGAMDGAIPDKGAADRSREDQR